MQFWKKVTSVALTMALAAATAAAEPAAAMAVARGSMKINGVAAPQSTAVFPGDRIEVAGGAARLSAKGGTVAMASDTAARVEANRIVLDHGGIVVNTVSGLTVRLGELEIAPAGEKARFEVLRNGNKLTVAARSGDLHLRNGGQTTVLGQGKMANYDQVPRSRMDDDDDQRWMLILIFAATAGALIAGLASDDEIPVSPAIP